MLVTKEVFEKELKSEHILPMQVIIDKGWDAIGHKTTDGKFFVQLNLKDYGLFNIASYESKEVFDKEFKNYFVISPQKRLDIMMAVYGNSIATYEWHKDENGYTLFAFLNNNETSFATETLNEHMYERVTENDISTLTINEVYEMMDEIGCEMMVEYEQSISEWNHNDECSICRGGGCPHCSPKDFI